MKAPLRVIPLGGLGEIGLNLMVIECGQDILLIDCGVLFPDLAWMGLDLVVPHFEYLIQNKERIKALVITHGHEDHIGAIPFLLREVKVPIVYASPFACRLIEEKCKEHAVAEYLLTHEVRAGDSQVVGCFEVEFIHVTHSTLETFALSIKTPHGLIIHSGDFKFDETPYSGEASDKNRFKELGKENPLLLLSDSTNSERCGHSKSESDITKELDRLVKETSGAVVVALFASNIHRVHQLMDIAEKYKRKIFLSGRSMERYVHIAIEQNHLPKKGDLLQPLDELERFPRNKILVLSTGSQGEARSSLLRLSKNENRWIKLKEGDSVILSSRNIPGNERAISYVLNQLYKLGADVHYEDMRSVHASGHAYQEEQIELLKFIKPQFFIPIHGEYRQLALHSKTAQESGYLQQKAFVLENGQVWEYDSENAKKKEDEVILTGRKWVFFDSTGVFEEERIKDRRAAARAGVVSVICQVSRNGTEILKDAEIHFSGFLGNDSHSEALKNQVQAVVMKAFQEYSEHNEWGMTREQSVGAAAKRVFKKTFDIKPLVIVHFIK